MRTLCVGLLALLCGCGNAPAERPAVGKDPGPSVGAVQAQAEAPAPVPVKAPAAEPAPEPKDPLAGLLQPARPFVAERAAPGTEGKFEDLILRSPTDAEIAAANLKAELRRGYPLLAVQVDRTADPMRPVLEDPELRKAFTELTDGEKALLKRMAAEIQAGRLYGVERAAYLEADGAVQKLVGTFFPWLLKEPSSPK